VININNIIDKNLAGESSLEEEGQLKAYLLSDKVDADHSDLIPLFQYYDSASKIEAQNDIPVQVNTQDTSALIEKYWAGETSLAEERVIKNYLLSNKVADNHKDLIPLFAFFEEQEGIMMQKSIDTATITGVEQSQLDLAIEAYWAGESSLEQEGLIEDYVAAGNVKSKHAELVPLFSYFQDQKGITINKDLELDKIAVKPEPKIRFMFPKVMAVAASLALLMMFTFNFMSNESASYKNAYTEVEDPEEALEITMEALAFLGKKYDKGTKPMKYIKELEKTDVFRFTK